MALIESIADAAVTAMNAHAPFAAQFTAEKRYLEINDKAQLADVRVLVVPKAKDSEIATRTQGRHEIDLDVVIEKAVDGSDVGALITLSETVTDFWRGRSLGDAKCLKSVTNPIYDAKWLREYGIFINVTTLTFHAVE